MIERPDDCEPQEGWPAVHHEEKRRAGAHCLTFDEWLIIALAGLAGIVIAGVAYLLTGGGR